MNKAIFLDRDGTLIKDIPYCSKIEDIQLLPTVIEGLKLLCKSDLKIIIITNQSGIARGYLTENTLNQIHSKMVADLETKGIRIDAIYYCPHHPDENCYCRKPNIGLLERAAREHNLNLSESYLIGDKFLDMQAANKAGCKTVLVPNSEPEIEILNSNRNTEVNINFACSDFITAAKWVNNTNAGTITLIIPTKNEADNLAYLLPRIPEKYDVMIVDGHSNDNTLEVVKKLRPAAKILHQSGTGKGNALKLGFKKSNTNIIVTFDADNSFNIKEIDKFVEPLYTGYDLTKGSRFLPGAGTADMPVYRRWANNLFTLLANILFGTNYTDLAYGFHAFKREILQKLTLQSDGFEIDTELYLKAKLIGINVKEIPSYENKRIYGQGKLRSFRDGWRIFNTIVRTRFVD